MSEIDLSSPDVKAAIKAAVEEATEGLVRKRDELLDENKKLKKGRSIDPADVEKLEGELQQAREDLAAAKKIADKAAKDADAARKVAADAESREQRLLVDNGLAEALAKAGVTNPVHVKAAKAMLAAQVQLVADGENRVAKIGDKALAEAIGEWAGSEEGKFFVTAPPNNGGGSQGGQNKGGGAAKSINRAAFDGLAPEDRMAHIQSGGTVTD